MVASVTIPIFGNILTYAGEKHFEKFRKYNSFLREKLCFDIVILGMVLIVSAHGLFRLFQDLNMKGEWFVVQPILVLGLAHALVTTMQGTLVNKLITNKKLIPQVFSTMKIFEGVGISIAIYANGHIRQSTGSYFGVSMFIILNASVGAAAALYLNHLVQMPKEEESAQADTSVADAEKIAKRYAKAKKEDDEPAPAEDDAQATELAALVADKKGQLLETYAGVMEIQEDDQDDQETAGSSSSAASTRKRTNKRMNYVL